MRLVHSSAFWPPEPTVIAVFTFMNKYFVSAEGQWQVGSLKQVATDGSSFCDKNQSSWADTGFARGWVGGPWQARSSSL